MKAYQILDTFSVSNAASTVRQISAKTGIPRSTVHELCQTLVATGQLEYNAGAGYQLGVRLVAMAGPVLERIGLIEASEPTMKRLGALPSGVIFLSLFTYPWITYIAFSQTRSKLSVRRNTGLRIPLHTSGSGITVLSELHDQAVGDYLEGLPAPVVNRVVKQIEKSRQDGYLLSKSSQQGISSVSTAISGNHGVPMGALALCESDAKLDEGTASKLGRILQEESRIIAKSIRHSASPVYD